jgi:hypothetical protein
MSLHFLRIGVLTQRAILFGLAVSICAPIWAQSTRVVSVEEHWELKLGQPDAERSAPQTTMFMSPDGDLDGVHFLFALNHVSVPQYEPGGMQVQLWNGDQVEDSVAAGQGALSHDQEHVHWVQKLALDDETLTFQVRDGESETWGAFGGESLTLSVPSSLTSLNGYKPGVSLTESQVGYAENRVVSLTLTKLVWTTEDGEVHELNAPIAVDTSLDP